MLANDWSTDKSMLHIVAWCRADLQEAADKGTTGMRLYTLVNGIRCFLHGQTQDVEGVNSVIRLLCDRCRNIGLQLLDARTRIKKALGLGSAGQSSRWSQRRPKALKVLEESLRHVEAGRAVVNEAGRFDFAVPAPLPPSHVKGGCNARVSPARKWAQACALKFHTSCKVPCVTKLFAFEAVLDVGATCYVIVDKNRAISYGVELSVSGHELHNGSLRARVTIKHPRRIVQALGLCIA